MTDVTREKLEEIEESRLVERKLLTKISEELKDIKLSFSVSESKLKEIKIELSTGERAQVEWATQAITGKIKSIIVETPNSTQIEFFIKTKDNILSIFEDREAFRIKQYMPKVEAIWDKADQKVSFGSEDWYLIKDKIHIHAASIKNNPILIKIRYLEM